MQALNNQKNLFFYDHILEQDNPGSLTVFALRDNIIQIVFDPSNYHKGCLVNALFPNSLKDRKIKCLPAKERSTSIGDFSLFYVIQFVTIYAFGNDLLLFRMRCKILSENSVFYEGV